MHPRILIIATTPYSENFSSRSLDAYFHYWEKDNLAQIFTRNIIPTKGHCGELYQITDAKLLDRWLNKTKLTGKIYHYDELSDPSINQFINNSSLQRIGTKHTPTIEILRRILWKKSFWCTDQLNEWLDSFKPDCVFYNFSNHIFTQQIALYVADRYNIPIITAIGDDFYFNDHRKISPAYHIYRKIFKKLTRKILLRKKSTAVYISDKIKDKYESVFGLNGETIYLSSTIIRKKYSPINTDCPVIAYFGNIRLGRNLSLLDFATSLGKINSNYKVEVYSGESDPKFYNVLCSHPNIIYGGNISYNQVKKRISECDIFLVVEGFNEENLFYTRYSLSTKAADALACGALVFAYGPEDAGVIEYLISTGAVSCCTDNDDLEECIKTLFFDVELQKKHYDQAISISQKNHNLEIGCKVFERIVSNTIA